MARPLRVLVACEYSGRVREAFRKLGHDAWSCDFEPAEDNSPYHMQCDLRLVLHYGWDLMICHPECTYLTCAAEWCYNDIQTKKLSPDKLYGAARRAAREEAVQFCLMLMNSPIPMIAMENPVGVLSSRYRKPDQIIQPYQFGDDASKSTCLWLKGLSKLIIEPDKRFPGRMVEWPKGSGKMIERWSNQTDSGQNKLTPSADRWKDRSRTFQGIADAFAINWGGNAVGMQRIH